MEHRSTTSGTEKHYDELAEQYEERWAKYLAHTHQRFLEPLETQSDDIILDLSCGTGLLAQHLINQSCPFKKLVLNDISAAMQQKAKERFDHRNDITFTNGSAEQLDFSDKSFDKICSLSAFHNYERQPQVLTECHRLLKPGGRLYILDWNRSGWFRIINQLIKIAGSEHIDTRSGREITAMLHKQHFEVSNINEWYHGSWKFYYVVCEKK